MHNKSARHLIGELMFQKLTDDKNSVIIYIDGTETVAEEGESVAAVLLRQDQAWSRTTMVSGEKRAPYCMMGVCFDCLAQVDGVSSVQTCLTPVHAGMKIERQIGFTKV